MPKKIKPIHPGEILLGEFMQPMKVSRNKLARSIFVPPNRISEIVAGHRSITPDTALRLAAFFGTTAEFWLNLQQHYDVSVTTADKSFLAEMKRILPATSDLSISR